MMRRSYASSCDQTSTPRSQQGGWTATGGTGVVRQRGTHAGSSKVVGVDDLAHGQRDGDGWMRPGRCEHLWHSCCSFFDHVPAESQFGEIRVSLGVQAEACCERTRVAFCTAVFAAAALGGIRARLPALTAALATRSTGSRAVPPVKFVSAYVGKPT